MRDADTYPKRAAEALQAVIEDRPTERDAQLDAMSADDLRSLTLAAQVLAVAARKAWLYRTHTAEPPS